MQILEQLLLPAHEASEPARCDGLQAPAERTGPDQLKDRHRLGESFNWKLTQGVDLHKSLGQSATGGGQPNTARSAELLHTRCQVRGLPHGVVVHVQVVAY